MIRALQTIGWSLLAPEPIRLEGSVICFLGQNGSGKSSALDAVKVALGCRRFGRDRSASSYRFAGRAGAQAARNAYVLCVVSNELPGGGRRLPDHSQAEVTLVCEVGPRQRRFLVLDGEQLLPTGDRLGEAVQRLREDHPRAAWLTPEEYGRRVLEPLGIGPALRRLLELPQGEIARALDREPRELVGVLLELSGGRDAADRFQAATVAVLDARTSHAEAARRLDRRRAELAEAKFAAQEAQSLREQRLQLSLLAGQAERFLHNYDELASLPPLRFGPLALNRRAVKQAGIDLALSGGYYAVRKEDTDLAAEQLGPGELLPVEGFDLDFLRQRGLIVTGPPVEESESASDDPTPQLANETEVRSLRRLLAELESAGIEPREEPDDEEWTAATLIGALRALTGHGVPVIHDAKPLEELAEMELLLSADTDELERRRNALSEAEQRLTETREAYEDAVGHALLDVAERFGELCHDAGLQGRMEVVIDGAEPMIEIWAAESEKEEMRPLHGAQASLSGGWRTTVVVLALLACLESESSARVICLDEVGSSLDEPRLVALGQAFATLGERRGLQTLMTLPTRAQSEAVADFASMQIGFFRPLPDEALAPPPHVVAVGLRAVTARAVDAA